MNNAPPYIRDRYTSPAKCETYPAGHAYQKALLELITRLQTDEMYHREALGALMEQASSRIRPEIRRVHQETRQSYVEPIEAIKNLVEAQNQ